MLKKLYCTAAYIVTNMYLNQATNARTVLCAADLDTKMMIAKLRTKLFIIFPCAKGLKLCFVCRISFTLCRLRCKCMCHPMHVYQ